MNETHFNGKENFVINVHNVICDVLMSRRSAIHDEVLKNFGLCLNFKMLDVEFNDRLQDMPQNIKLIDEHFKHKFVHFFLFIKEENITNPVNMCKLLIGDLRSLFPNVTAILKTFLTIYIAQRFVTHSKITIEISYLNSI